MATNDHQLSQRSSKQVDEADGVRMHHRLAQGIDVLKSPNGADVPKTKTVANATKNY